MIKNDIFSWKGDVWPDSYKANPVCLMENSSAMIISAGNEQIWHRSFAIGFFGFHYIRAANDNDFYLQTESLQILRGLVESCCLGKSILRGLKVTHKHTYTDFRNNVLRQVSLELGDAQGRHIQKAMELGYGLAGVYTCLVGIIDDKGSEKIEGCLGVLEKWTSDILKSTEQAGMSKMLIQLLAELKNLLGYSKSRKIASQCIQALKLILSHLLSSMTTTGLARDS